MGVCIMGVHTHMKQQPSSPLQGSDYLPIRSPSAVPQEQLRTLMISHNTAVKRPSSQ